MKMRLGVMLAVLLGLGVSAATAQEMDGMDHSTMDHGTMEHGSMNHGTTDKNAMPGMDHSTMDHGTMDHSGMNHGTTGQSAMPAMDHGTMDHSTMSHDATSQSTMPAMDHGAMQGGSAPADARDPHAYSGGYTLVAGPYALPGPRLLHLADEHNFGSLLVDRLEAVHTADDNSMAYDIQAWYGRDYDRAVLKAEGEVNDGDFEEASTELLWAHALTAYWNSQLGVRFDGGEGPQRTWLALGVQGLAPYWFEVDATAYVGDEGRTALNLEAEYELLLTQKLILQPRLEADWYGKADDERGIGSGLSSAAAGLRLRYEIRREFAPYVGVEWSRAFGATADFARDAGGDIRETRIVAGVRAWF